jgi:hypothetical protein
MMNRYDHHPQQQQQHHPSQTHNSTLPSNHHFHLSSSTTTTTTTVLQTPLDTYTSSNNSIVDLHQQNHYNLLDDNYVYTPPPSYCTKHPPIYRSPTICTLDSQPSVYETYSSSTPSNIPVNTYEQFCIDNSQTSPSSSSWITTPNEGTIYHPIQSFDQCNIYLNNSQLSDQNYRDYSSIPLSNNETSSSSSSSTTSSSFNNNNNLQQQYHPQQQSSLDEKPLAIVASEAKYKWMQIKRTPAKTAGKFLCFFANICSRYLILIKKKKRLFHQKFSRPEIYSIR